MANNITEKQFFDLTEDLFKDNDKELNKVNKQELKDSGLSVEEEKDKGLPFKVEEDEKVVSSAVAESMDEVVMFFDRKIKKVNHYIDEVVEVNKNYVSEMVQFTGNAEDQYKLVESDTRDLEEDKMEFEKDVDILKDRLEKGELKKKAVFSELKHLVNNLNSDVENKKWGNIEKDKESFVKIAVYEGQEKFNNLKNIVDLEEKNSRLVEFTKKLDPQDGTCEYMQDDAYKSFLLEVDNEIDINMARIALLKKEVDENSENGKKGNGEAEKDSSEDVEEENEMVDEEKTKKEEKISKLNKLKTEKLTKKIDETKSLDELLLKVEEIGKILFKNKEVVDFVKQAGSMKSIIAKVEDRENIVWSEVEEVTSRFGIKEKFNELLLEENEEIAHWKLSEAEARSAEFDNKDEDDEKQEEDDSGNSSRKKFGRSFKGSVNRHDRSLIEKKSFKFNEKNTNKLVEKIKEVDDMGEFLEMIKQLGIVEIEKGETVDFAEAVDYMESIIDSVAERGNIVWSDMQKVVDNFGIQRKFNRLLHVKVKEDTDGKKGKHSQAKIKNEDKKFKWFSDKKEVIHNIFKSQITGTAVKTLLNVTGSVLGVRSIWTTLPFLKEFAKVKHEKHSINKLFKNLDDKSGVDLGDVYKAEDGADEKDKLKPGDVIDLKKIDEIEMKVHRMVGTKKLSEEEGNEYLEKLNNLIENYKEERESLINGTNDKLKATLDEYVQNKEDAALAAREAMNTALVFSGNASYRWAMYGLTGLAQRYIKERGEDSSNLTKVKKIFNEAVVDTFKDAGALFAKKENRKLGETLNSISAIGKIAMYSGMLYGRSDQMEPWLEFLEKHLLNFGGEDLSEAKNVITEAEADFHKTISGTDTKVDVDSGMPEQSALVSKNISKDDINTQENLVGSKEESSASAKPKAEAINVPDQSEDVKHQYGVKDVGGGRLVIAQLADKLVAEGVDSEVAEAAAVDGEVTVAEERLVKKDVSDELKLSILKNEVSVEDVERLDYVEGDNLFGAKTSTGTRGGEDLRAQILKNIETSGDVERSIATVYKGEGILHAFRRQLEASPVEFGYTGDVDNIEKVKDWSAIRAYSIAEDAGYVDEATGQSEVRVKHANSVAYSLKIDGENLIVEEFVKESDGTFLDMGTDRAVFGKIENPEITGSLERELENYEYRHDDPMPSSSIEDVQTAEEKIVENIKNEEEISLVESVKKELKDDKYFEDAEKAKIQDILESDITEKKAEFIEHRVLDSLDKQFYADNLKDIFAASDQLKNYSLEEIARAYKDVPYGIDEHKISYIKFLLNSNEDNISRDGVREMFNIDNSELNPEIANSGITRFENVKLVNGTEMFNLIIDRSATPPTFGFEVSGGDNVSTRGGWTGLRPTATFSDKNIEKYLRELKLSLKDVHDAK